MIERVRSLVKSECDTWNWHYHIIPVVKYSKLLARELHVSEEISELAALLHDIGRIRFGSHNHEITGINEAARILEMAGYTDQVINEIKHCIETHRGNGPIKPKTIYAKITASADALSHFDIIPAMIQAGLIREENDIEKAVNWVSQKIERDFHEKLLISHARNLAKNKYDAFRILIDAMQEYFINK